VTWVDGGMLANFPIDALIVSTASPALANHRYQAVVEALEMPTTVACHESSQEAMRCLRTMMNEWDRYHVDQATAARTIFVDNLGLSATQFDLTPQQQDQLFLSGVRAATSFLIEMSTVGGVRARSSRRAASPSDRSTEESRLRKGTGFDCALPNDGAIGRSTEPSPGREVAHAQPGRTTVEASSDVTLCAMVTPIAIGRGGLGAGDRAR